MLIYSFDWKQHNDSTVKALPGQLFWSVLISNWEIGSHSTVAKCLQTPDWNNSKHKHVGNGYHDWVSNIDCIKMDFNFNGKTSLLLPLSGWWQYRVISPASPCLPIRHEANKRLRRAHEIFFFSKCAFCYFRQHTDLFATDHFSN